MRTNKDFFNICDRETGLRRPRHFARHISANEEIVKRLDQYGELKGHNDRISSMEFNSSGDLLVSGSFDRQVIFWNWKTKTRRLSYDTGHLDKLYQAKIMPYTNDRRIVTACKGGQVRIGEVLEDGQVHTNMLGCHRGVVCKLAVEPGNPNIIYSCGSDSSVQHFDLRSNSATKLVSCNRVIKGSPHPGKLYLLQMVFDPTNPNYFCLGGGDVFARVYDIRKCWQDTSSSSLVKPVNTFCPPHLRRAHYYMITGLAYSNSGELLVSYCYDLIYLFQKNMGLGSAPPSSFEIGKMEVLNKPEQFAGHRNSNPCTVSFFGPNDEYVLSGSYCSHIFIWKKNGGEVIRIIKGDRYWVNDIHKHPHDLVIATCGSEKNLKLWAPVADEDVSPMPKNIAKIMEFSIETRKEVYRSIFSDYI